LRPIVPAAISAVRLTKQQERSREKPDGHFATYCTGVSIAALFTGGLLPGVVLATTLSALVWWRYRDEDLSHARRAGGGEIAKAFVIALPARCPS